MDQLENFLSSSDKNASLRANILSVLAKIVDRRSRSFSEVLLLSSKTFIKPGLKSCYNQRVEEINIRLQCSVKQQHSFSPYLPFLVLSVFFVGLVKVNSLSTFRFYPIWDQE